MQCGICHNPVMTGGGQSIDFRTMVHRIHTGKEMTRTYTIGSSKFNEVGYPGDRRNCGACHVNNSQQLPLQEGLVNVSDPAGFMTSVPPVTAACTSCHDTKAATAHAAVNTDAKQGESCDVCHGPVGAVLYRQGPRQIGERKSALPHRPPVSGGRYFCAYNTDTWRGTAASNNHWPIGVSMPRTGSGTSTAFAAWHAGWAAAAWNWRRRSSGRSSASTASKTRSRITACPIRFSSAG